MPFCWNRKDICGPTLSNPHDKQKPHSHADVVFAFFKSDLNILANIPGFL
jgi:hypothetical protein